jgi:hypothetical protein
MRARPGCCRFGRTRLMSEAFSWLGRQASNRVHAQYGCGQRATANCVREGRRRTKSRFLAPRARAIGGSSLCSSAVGAIRSSSATRPPSATVRAAGWCSDFSVVDSPWLGGADRQVPDRPALEVLSKRAVRHLRGRLHRSQMNHGSICDAQKAWVMLGLHAVADGGGPWVSRRA